MRRVVVTGLGCVSPLGNSVDETWAGIKAGKSGINTITHYDNAAFKVKYAAEVKNFKASDYMDSSAARKMAMYTQYAVAAAKMALDDSSLMGKADVLEDTAVYLGVGIGGLEVTENTMKAYFESNQTRMSPMTIPMLIPNEGAGNIAIALGAKGPCQVVTTACASSTDALGFAMDLIRAGRADVVVAGGSEAVIIEFTVGGFMKEKALSTHFNDTPEKACRPFNQDRDGFVMGEGAAILVLESEEHAKTRGAKVYAELAGYGATCDAYHITAPDPSADGAVRAIEIALKDAGVTDKSTVGYINAHGTSTHLNDQMETNAFKRVFGEEGAKKINISSTKPCHGHCLGATGAIEAAITALAIKEGFVPPTINYEKPDLEVDASKGETPLDLNYTPNVGVKRDIDVALSSSLGFGGHNGILVLKKVEG